MYGVYEGLTERLSQIEIEPDLIFRGLDPIEKLNAHFDSQFVRSSSLVPIDLGMERAEVWTTQFSANVTRTEPSLQIIEALRSESDPRES